MGMTPQQLRELYNKASESTKRRNPELGTENATRPSFETRTVDFIASNPVVEPSVGTQSLGKVSTQGDNTKRFLVRVESRRIRLLDPDNLVGGAKYVIDACRQCGAIPGDAPHQIELEVFQTKVASKEAEQTIVEIIPPHCR